LLLPTPGSTSLVCRSLGGAYFPHSAIATATLLTEGPAQLFAIMGALVGSNQFPDKDSSLSFILSSVAVWLWIATISRQYYLALLPAAGQCLIPSLGGTL